MDKSNPRAHKAGLGSWWDSCYPGRQIFSAHHNPTAMLRAVSAKLPSFFLGHLGSAASLGRSRVV